MDFSASCLIRMNSFSVLVPVCWIYVCTWILVIASGWSNGKQRPNSLERHIQKLIFPLIKSFEFNFSLLNRQVMLRIRNLKGGVFRLVRDMPGIDKWCNYGGNVWKYWRCLCCRWLYPPCHCPGGYYCSNTICSPLYVTYRHSFVHPGNYINIHQVDAIMAILFAFSPMPFLSV
jgi:hypothetical protein